MVEDGKMISVWKSRELPECLAVTHFTSSRLKLMWLAVAGYSVLYLINLRVLGLHRAP